MNKEEILYTQFDNVFFEKTRLSMMTLLFKEGLVSFNRFKRILAGSDGAIFAHLKKLQDSKYVAHKKEITGTKAETFYYLTAEGKKLFKKYLKFLQEVITE